MTIQEIVNLSSSWSRNPPASRQMVLDCATSLALRFPENYVEFLLLSNGGEAYTSPEHPAGYFILFTTEKLVTINKMMEVQTTFPGHLAIGSNGYEEMFLMNTLVEEAPVVMIPELDNDMEFGTNIGNSFQEFLIEIIKKSR